MSAGYRHRVQIRFHSSPTQGITQSKGIIQLPGRATIIAASIHLFCAPRLQRFDLVHRSRSLLGFADDVPGVDDARNPSENAECDVCRE